MFNFCGNKLFLYEKCSVLWLCITIYVFVESAPLFGMEQQSFKALTECESVFIKQNYTACKNILLQENYDIRPLIVNIRLHHLFPRPLTTIPKQDHTFFDMVLSLYNNTNKLSLEDKFVEPNESVKQFLMLLVERGVRCLITATPCASYKKLNEKLQLAGVINQLFQTKNNQDLKHCITTKTPEELHEFLTLAQEIGFYTNNTDALCWIYIFCKEHAPPKKSMFDDEQPLIHNISLTQLMKKALQQHLHQRFHTIPHMMMTLHLYATLQSHIFTNIGFEFS